MSWLIRTLGGAKATTKAAASQTYSANPQTQLQGPTGWPYGLDNFFAYRLKWTRLNVPQGTVGWAQLPKATVRLPEPYTGKQGVLLTAMWHVDDTDAYNNLCPVLLLEDQRMDFYDWGIGVPHQLTMATINSVVVDAATGMSKSGGWHWGQFSAALAYYTLWFSGQLPYSSNFEIGFENVSTAAGYHGDVMAWLLLERRRGTQ